MMELPSLDMLQVHDSHYTFSCSVDGGELASGSCLTATHSSTDTDASSDSDSSAATPVHHEPDGRCADVAGVGPCPET